MDFFNIFPPFLSLSPDPQYFVFKFSHVNLHSIEKNTKSKVTLTGTKKNIF